MGQRRALVLTQVIAGKVDVGEAALLLGLSERSVRRLRARILAAGPQALVHGNAGRRPAHSLDPELARRVVTLATTTYAGCNDSHLAELLAEREAISLSRASVQRLLRRAGIPSPRRHRPTRYRSRRERRAAAGMLIQLDGSRHRWFGPDRPFATLLGAIDDATGEVLGATFREHEDVAGYFEVLRQLLERGGVPLAVYSDRHSIFWRSDREREDREEELAGEREPTQLGRAFAELEVEMVYASSPQAKGRVERLWGTFQDRLVSEMRLAAVADIAAANAFLSTYLVRHNARFAVAATEPPAWRGLPVGRSASSVCSFKYSRVVAADNTLRLGSVLLQLPPRGAFGSWAHQRVECRQHLDGSWSILAPGGRELARSAVPLSAPKLRAEPYKRAPVAGVAPLPRPGATWRRTNSDLFKRKLSRTRSRSA